LGGDLHCCAVSADSDETSPQRIHHSGEYFSGAALLPDLLHRSGMFQVLRDCGLAARRSPCQRFQNRFLPAMNLRLLAAAFAALLLPVSAQESADKKEPAKEGGEKQQPAGSDKEEKQIPRVKATDMISVRDLVGEEAIVTGKVTRTFNAEKDGITFINLEGGKFIVICWKRNYSKFPGENPAELYKDKVIEITGKVKEYRKKQGVEASLEIELKDPSQIKILDKKATDEKEKSDKKDAGKEDKKAKAKDEAKKEEGKKKDAASPA
jgi:DNA/RNA endonuclease YhcR with UshA esterase domain